MAHIKENTRSATAEVPNIPNWKKNVDTYTGDDLIDAFIKGKEAGRDEHFRILMSQFNQNIQKAVEVSENLYQQLVGNDYSIKTIHLKPESISKFTALLVADSNQYVSDRFLKVFSLARKIKNEVETENFYISFHFMPYSEKISQDCLNSDGYFLKYEKK